MMKIGILCPSEIAFRRFLPSLKKCEDLFEYVGVACADKEEWCGGIPEKSLLDAERDKAKRFCDDFGGGVFDSYAALLASDIDCVYVPLPPALHFQWGKRALEHGKHLFMEKPFTASLSDTQELLNLAREKSLAVHENYMFQFHNQIKHIQDELEKGTIGELRLIRINFGFPFRGVNDFRYDKSMGGGALLDCGGYTIRLASLLLGESARLVYASSNQRDGYDVDIYGSAIMVNDTGLVAQIAFGMDNEYRCDLDIWGSIGSMFTGRVLTAPDGFSPVLQIKTGADIREKELLSDDAFQKSIAFFHSCITQQRFRDISYGNILRQAELIEIFKEW